MNLINFIEFNKDKDLALSKRASVLVELYKFTGIQLLPENKLPYIQTTNVVGGIELEDYTVKVLKVCNDKFTGTDITVNFDLVSIFQDTNGNPQITWSLTDLPIDFGTELIYLEVKQAFGETFYSSPFQITDIDAERTCRIDYKAKESDIMQSTQLQMFFWQSLKTTEISSYYETSTRNTVTINNKSQKYERWTTEFMDNDLLIKIDDAFENRFVYIDLIRCNLFEAIEIKEFEHSESYKNNNIKLSFNRSDVYNPLAIEPISILEPKIFIESVVGTAVDNIPHTEIVFSLENFNPSELVFATWGLGGDVNSAVKTTRPYNGNNTEYFAPPDQDYLFFQIIHPQISSNIFEYVSPFARSINVGNVFLVNNSAVFFFEMVNFFPTTFLLVAENTQTNEKITKAYNFDNQTSIGMPFAQVGTWLFFIEAGGVTSNKIERTI